MPDMKSFLEYVAADLMAKYGTDLSHVAVVFPNKRASLFLNEHLARLAGKPLWSPAYITISELFRSHATLKVADPIQLVCELYQCFTQCTGIDETLDHFYGWGQLLLADFDDLDKNMAPADKVFANLRDIHELDDISYLSAEQKEIIRRFFSNFSEDHNSELKQRFLRLWSRMGDIYHTFNRRLASQQLAYEGALYRQVATDEDIQFHYDTYIFIGFNMLQQVEQTLFRRLKAEGRARFYWDFDDYYLGKNEAGHYIAQYLSDFPNELDNHDASIYSSLSHPKQLSYISASTENIQARYISQWLDEGRIADGRRTAIVLCDEALLPTAIHCLPEAVEKVNVTTGYPLNLTPAATLVSQLLNVHVFGRSKITGRYQPRLLRILNQHPYAPYLSIDTLPDDILPWLRDTIRQVAVSIQEPDALTQESLFRTYTLLNRVCELKASGGLDVDIITLQRLIMQIIQSTTIPFHGEPAEGIQVMGVLETRNLDFDHVLLLSCNEGNMPRGVNDTSFIPYSIRKAYGLTTVDHKVAIYAYYFHRLLQRASDVTIVYNNATNDGQTGEMSRFMLQLMVESGHPITFRSLKSGQTINLRMPHTLEKTEAVMQILRQRFSSEQGGISPTAISNYLRCPLRFFYRYVCNLIEPDDNEEDLIDNRIFGNIFHLAAQTIYERLKTLTGNHVTTLAIDDLLKSEVEIEQAVDAAIKRELFQMKDLSRPMPPLDGIQLINREVIIKYVRQLLETDRRLTPFTILGLEKKVSMPFEIMGDQSFQTIIGGYIDRLDQVTDPETGEPRIRVVDYKTGGYRLKALPDIEAIFDPQNIKDHSDYYQQAFLYSHIVRRETTTPVSPALLFIQHAGADDYDPTLCLGKEPVRDIASVSDTFMQLLSNKMGEIFDPAQSLTPTDDRKRCDTCPYAAICGR
jgi:CRISPR/Cas system-associated exonuclease Cas4 (RecB family)